MQNDQDVSYDLTRFVHTASNGDETNDYLNNFSQIYIQKQERLIICVCNFQWEQSYHDSNIGIIRLVLTVAVIEFFF